MSILIKGMEMPKAGNWKTIRIYPDGTCAVPNWQGDCTLLPDVAVSVPPHGDLIDRDALSKQLGITDMHCLKCALGNYGLCTKGPEFVVACKEIEDAPTIIDAENK